VCLIDVASSDARCVQPEMQAQTTLINFTVTRDGLEEQLLAAVVAKERPDLEKLKASLTHQQNEFKITLKSLEDSLLARLSTAEGNFLGDYDLVENLETTKRTAMEIEEKVEEAKLTESKINEAREAYRPVAMRASLLYFVLNDLNKIHPMYQFSLKVRRLFLFCLREGKVKVEPTKPLAGCSRGGHLHYYRPLRPSADKPLKSVTHGPFDAEPTVTFPPSDITVI